MNKFERRYVPAEIRQAKEGVIEGYAAVFNQLSEDLGGFRESIRQGAFKKTIKESDIRGLFNHDANFVLGRNTAGTLKLSEDENGLYFEVDPPDAQWARDLYVSIERRDITQASFGFQTIRDSWDDLDDEQKRKRELIEVKLFDVGPVAFPAYVQTEVNTRGQAEILLHELRVHPDSDVAQYVLSQLGELIGVRNETNEDDAPGLESHPSESDVSGITVIESPVELQRLKIELLKLKG